MPNPSPCPGGGPTGPLPGTPAVVAVTATAVESALILAGFPEVAAILAPFLVLQNFAVADFCGQGPPPLPVLGPQDMLDVVNMTDPTVSFPAIDKFKQWWAVHQWYLLCGCTAATTPPPPALVLPPGPGADQGLPSGAPGQPCYSASASWQLPNDPNYPGGAAMPDPMPLLFPPAWLVTAAHPQPLYSTQVFAAGITIPTQWEFTLTVDQVPTRAPIGVNFRYWTGSVWNSQTVVSVAVGQASPTSTATFPNSQLLGGGPVGNGFLVESAEASARHVTVSVTEVCGSPLAPNSPCCPPDPLVSNYLNQILNLEQLIYQKLGTGGAPPAYTRGTRHVGLSGAGTLNVTGLFGVLVELTAGTPTNPQLPGVPPYQWSVGWVSVLTGDGMIDEIRLTRQAQVWASRLAPYATEVGYQLNAGFTADVTELLPA